jgi:L-ascorbate metabolism protein UlaG (beta-lactamase superfamily)
MKRRQFIQTAGASTLGEIAGFSFLKGDRAVQAQTGSISVEWLGHTCFFISGGGLKVLVNPFKAVGCTKGYKESFPQADVVLITSQLFDEGYVENIKGDPTILWQAGQYTLKNTSFNGISMDHANAERYRGWRFPTNVAWSWTQGGVNILHLGGAGEEVDIDDFILSGGSPDVLMLPVGGTDAYVNESPSFPPKGYKPQQAVNALDLLKPKVILPTHYLSSAADETCRLSPVDDFLGLLDSEMASVTKLSSNRLQLSASSLSKQTKAEVKVFSDRPLL